MKSRNPALTAKEFTVPESHEPVVWLRKAYFAFHRRVNAWMLSHGITADQFVMLRIIAREPGITQTRIVQRATSDSSTVAAILRLLERQGLIRREAHPRDRRARCVFLTAAGRRLEQRTFRGSEPLRAALSSCVDQRDHGQSLRFLQRVHQVFSEPAVGESGRRPKRLPARQRG